ncbi:MAG TPA: NAD(P)/FAD-dependent oxidoreductase [Acidimicrobiia bacterium]|jgi:phytoene dehydrogenase-like protein
MTEVRDVAIPDDVEGIFVGGGHNALICATYLARAGMKVVVCEASDRIGGGTTTDEITLPFFRHNLHAYFVRWTPEYAVWNDLDLGRFGVRSVYPPVQNMLPFDGGERALVTYADLDRSIAEIAKLSERDAVAYRQFHAEFSELTRRVDTPLRFSQALPPEQLQKLLGKSKLGRRYLELDRQSPLEVVRGAFESEPLRSLILFNVAVRGYLPNLDVAGIGSIAALALANSHQGRMVEGGTYEVAKAIASALLDAGGMILTNSRVERITVDNGRAVGVELTDGRRISTRGFVASSAPAPMTMLELVGGDHLDPGLRDDLAEYRWLEEALFGVHWALAERPRFTAEAYNPDAPDALNLALGYETSDDLLAHMNAVNAARNTEDGPVHSSIPTIHDPTQAPTGRHTTFGWHFVPGPPTRGSWDSAAVRDRVDAMVGTYRTYAPNIEDVTMALTSHSPDATERRVISMRGGDRHHGSFHPDNWQWNRPTSAMPGYRTTIEGLYLCGASQHPGGSFHGQPGYNAAGVIAEDHGVDAWWGPVDAASLLAELD